MSQGPDVRPTSTTGMDPAGMERTQMAAERSASGARPAIGPPVGVAVELRGADLGPEQVGQLALGVLEGNELVEMDEDHYQLPQRSPAALDGRLRVPAG